MRPECGRCPAHAFGLEHVPLGPVRRSRRRRDRRLRDAEGVVGCPHSRASGMDSGARQRPEHGAARRGRPGAARGVARLPRLSASTPRAVHVGRHAPGCNPSRRDRRIPARERGARGVQRPAEVRGGCTMAIAKIPAEDVTLLADADVTAFLAAHGIEYERWLPEHAVAADASSDTLLAAYGREIDRLKARGGYVTADVIDVKPDTPNLDMMLAKFSREHFHDEDEVRFIIEGRGLFHIHPRTGSVFAIEVEAGDLIRVPRGTHHWFDLCAERHIRAIRLFQDVSGWTPHYTDSGVDKGFQPLCFGPAYVPAGSPAIDAAK